MRKNRDARLSTKHRSNLCNKQGSVHGTVVADWTGQLVERSILHQGHDAQQIHLISPDCPWPSIALHMQNCGLKHQSFLYLLIKYLYNKHENKCSVLKDHHYC